MSDEDTRVTVRDTRAQREKDPSDLESPPSISGSPEDFLDRQVIKTKAEQCRIGCTPIFNRYGAIVMTSCAASCFINLKNIADERLREAQAKPVELPPRRLTRWLDDKYYYSVQGTMNINRHLAEMHRDAYLEVANIKDRIKKRKKRESEFEMATIESEMGLSTRRLEPREGTGAEPLHWDINERLVDFGDLGDRADRLLLTGFNHGWDLLFNRIPKLYTDGTATQTCRLFFTRLTDGSILDFTREAYSSVSNTVGWFKESYEKAQQEKAAENANRRPPSMPPQPNLPPPITPRR